jgi:general secretion pathway protein G
MNGRKPLRRFHDRGFTLVELVIIIVVLGILGAFVAVKYSDFVHQSKVEATMAEMQALKRAIVGNSQIASGGKYTDIGYEGNLGSPPPRLEDLAVKPAGVDDYNKISGLGWNGPYIDPDNDDYLKDAWGISYAYNPGSRTIKSTGSGQDIIVSF